MRINDNPDTGGYTIHLYWSEVAGLAAELPYVEGLHGTGGTEEFLRRLRDHLEKIGIRE